MTTSERQRDPEREASERLRFAVVEWLHRQVGEDCEMIVSASELAEELGVAAAEVFAATEYLARKQLIGYHGAGPRICMTKSALECLRSANKRRSLRDAMA